MTRRVLLLAVAVAVVSLPVRPAVRVLAATPHPQTLTALVSANSLTRDTNGDGLADVVAARVIVPASPSLADLETATNLAARLGYETTALTLPLTNALTIDGWFGDAYADLIPDRTDAVIVLGTPADAFGATHIAARIGLETTGAAGTGRFSMNAWPQVTFFSGGTEAPDETAQGEWLNLVAKAGFSYLMANVKYLRDGQYGVQRIEEDGARDSVSRTSLPSGR